MSEDVIFTQKSGTDPSGFLLGTNNLTDVASAPLSRNHLGLGTAATHAATDFDVAGAAATVQAASLQKTQNLLDVSDTATARTNLGLGTAATHAATDFDVAGAAAPAIDVTVNTTDATANVVAATYTPPHNSIVHAEGSFLALEASGADAKYRKVNAAFLTDNLGAVSIIGTATGGDTHATAGASAWGSNLRTDGTVVQFVVTGASLTNINWRVIGDVETYP